MSGRAQRAHAQHRVGVGGGLGQRWGRKCLCEQRGIAPLGWCSGDRTKLTELRGEWVLALWAWRSWRCRGGVGSVWRRACAVPGSSVNGGNVLCARALFLRLQSGPNGRGDGLFPGGCIRPRAVHAALAPKPSRPRGRCWDAVAMLGGHGAGIAAC
eukprot:7164102-Alexandrium_andersonii.AAC.1